jgi:2-polyprenyl-6-methoxyphenol hydroxylase-like FAD-dependent oxidoreductase
MESASASPEKLQSSCCIAGGGPAGMMLGFLLARAGIDVVVLEKHADFLRDFRGDTIHPSTLEVMHELGILEMLLKRPHQKLPQLRAQIGSTEVVMADFSRLPVQCPFIALMPQWDFLDFLAEQARRYPTFHLRMQAEVTGLIEEAGRVVGARAKTPTDALEVRAQLVVGADGRNSVIRDCSGLKVEEFGAPMDGLWLRLPRKQGDPTTALRFDRGKIMVMIDRGDYWQCAFVIRKGGNEETQRKGLEYLRASIVEIAPFLEDRVSELRDWGDIKLLSVRVDRLRQWYRPGLLCIGDAAHAMSPIGGVGINLAIQDAVAAANILVRPLREGVVTAGHLAPDHLAKIQRRRLLPTRLTQGFQLVLQKRLIARVLATTERVELPWPLRRMLRSKFLSRIRGRIVGIGFRPEHAKTPDLYK